MQVEISGSHLSPHTAVADFFPFRTTSILARFRSIHSAHFTTSTTPLHPHYPPRTPHPIWTFQILNCLYQLLPDSRPLAFVICTYAQVYKQALTYNQRLSPRTPHRIWTFQILNCLYQLLPDFSPSRPCHLYLCLSPHTSFHVRP